MRISRLLLTCAAVAHAAAAQTTTGTPAAPAKKGPCLFAGPMVGANLFTLQLSQGTPWESISGYLPGVRVGMDLPTGFIAGEAGLGGLVFAGSGIQLGLKVGATYGHDLFKLGPLQGYGLGGLNVGLAAQVPNWAVPTTQLSIGAGLEYEISPQITLAGEGGLRCSLGFGGGGTDATCGAYAGLVGEYYLPGSTCGSTTTEHTPQGPAISVAETPEPGLTPGSTTYPSSTATPCGAYPADGWFEPTQGVWQDDVSFEDKPTKQLTRAPFGGIAYHAELDMVQHKDSLLFGIHHYQLGTGGAVQVDSRDFIVIKGFTNCPDSKPVKLRFTLREGGAEQEIWTSPILATIPLEGAALPQYTPWEVRLPVRAGVPDTATFRFQQAGPYQLKAELQRGDTGALTGLFMTVDGNTVPTQGPIVHFVPVLLSATEAEPEEKLKTSTETLAADTAAQVPDLFPLAPGGLPTAVKVLRNFIHIGVPDRWFESRRVDYTVAALNDSLAASVFLTGAGRIVAVMQGKDFTSIFGEGAAGVTVAESVKAAPRGGQARTLSWKVMLVPDDSDWSTVAHEIVHTLPEGWASDGMQAECGRAYHNKRDPIAHGEVITFKSAPTATRERMVGEISYMGPDTLLQTWSDQCTYWHLLKVLDGGPPDPPVMMVRALVGKKGNKVMGELRPVYELMGYADLAARPGGPYAFVFKDAAGKELARFPFTPRTADIETGQPREVTSAVYRVPLVHDWAQLELQGPGNAVLDRKTRTAAPPRVRITAPTDGERVIPVNGKVRLAWEGQGAGPLLYSVLYSPDGGRSWTDQSFEQTETSSYVVLAKEPRGKDHRLKVIATDGTRSAEAVVQVAVTGP